MVECDVRRIGPVKISTAIDAAETVSEVDGQSQILADTDTLVLVSASVLCGLVSRVHFLFPVCVSFSTSEVYPKYRIDYKISIRQFG